MRGPRREVDDHEVSTPEMVTASEVTKAIEFVRRWMPYGGADSYEIFVTFGLTPVEFGRRLDRALLSPHGAPTGSPVGDDRESLAREVNRFLGVGHTLESGGS